MKTSRFFTALVFITGVLSAGPATAQEKITPDLSDVRAKLQSGSDPVTIVCFGDSVTGLYYHTGGRRTYTDMLGIALKQTCSAAEVKMINAGISGHTTANALARIEKDVLARKPDLVTVMFGLNDMAKIPALETYEENLGTIIDKCRGAGAEVILCTPNAVTTTSSRPVEKLEKYCEAVRQVAKEKRVPLCDSYAAFQKMRKRDPLAWRLTMSDAIHPNMAGHKGIAEQLSETITGKTTSLAGVGPQQPAITHSLSLLKENQPVKILAMPPYDELIEPALQSFVSGAKVEVTKWPVAGQDLKTLAKDASRRVRKMKPDLVLIASPRSATAANQEEFIHSVHWLANWSLSFGKAEWDCVVIHRSVAEPATGRSENDDLIRKLTAAHDLSLIDRGEGDRREAAEILADWLKSQNQE